MKKNEFIKKLNEYEDNHEVLFCVSSYNKDDELEREYFRIDDSEFGSGMNEIFIEIASNE